MHGKIPVVREIDGQVFKQCNICNEFKSLDSFYKNVRYYLGTQHECKACVSIYSKKRNTAEKNRENTLRKYQLTTDDYQKLYAEQNANCKICNQHFDLLHVDHDHATGQVRGLLCNPCNNALGLLKDDIELLQNAITYLMDYLINSMNK